MKFMSSRGGAPLSLAQASCLGYPGEEGFFLPSGEADLRATVYAPSSGFTDTLALSMVELLADELDPPSILELAGACFSREPEAHPLGGDILVLDLARGPTASSYDYAASFSAAFLSRLAEPGRDFFLAAARGREASALASAYGQLETDLPLVILKPSAGDAAEAAASACPGIPGVESGASGGKVIPVEVRGSLADCARLERLASLSGRDGFAGISGLGGKRAIPCGALSPAYLLGRSLLFVGLFAMARRGLSGELIVAAPPSDIPGLVTGLWAWSWGLPVTSFLVPRRLGEESSSLLDSLLAGNEVAGEARGAELLERFNREYPLSSLVMGSEVSFTAGDRENALRLLPDGLALDSTSALALSAAEAALADGLAGLAGHARIVVPRFADPRWDQATKVDAPLPDPAAIPPSLEALSSAIAALL
jgi:threonine synthase